MTQPVSTHNSQLTLLVDPPQDGLTNMAVDEALLSLAGEGQLGPVLRFYEWSPATLSLGYFQPRRERARHPASGGCDIVRRASGGGAILHDRELTYSLVLPAGHPLAARAEPLYRAVHQTLVEVLAERGLEARFWNDVAPARSGEFFTCGEEVKRGANRTGEASIPKPPPPFLCFQRRAPGDLVLRASDNSSSDTARWHKILGSAQRRRRGAVLQHGSLLLGQSAFAPELPGLCNLIGTNFAYLKTSRSYASAWGTKLAAMLDFELTAERRSAAIVPSVALALAREKFHESAWLELR